MSSSRYRTNVTLNSVLSSPRSESDTICAVTDVWICIRTTISVHLIVTSRGTHHLESPSDDTLQDLRINKPSLDGLLRQLHKVGQRILVEKEREGGLELSGRHGVLDQSGGDGE
jgi:hypothetical protein